MNKLLNRFAVLLLILCLPLAASCYSKPQPDQWPKIENQAKPWTYWWWMGSAVDKENISSQLKDFQKTGLGGVHIIPIYGAKGYEDRYIDYLSPEWMEMLDYTVSQAKYLGLGVDMTLGTGWCFGGPNVTRQQANARLQHRIQTLNSGQKPEKLSDASVQIVMAYGPDGQTLDLSDRIADDRTLNWTAPQDQWTLYELWQKPSGRKVKRAAPGGTGHMLNPFYKDAMVDYLKWFDKAFDEYDGAMPRAIYHDSYEYVCDWSPNLLEEFQARRGYRLQDHLTDFFAESPSDTTARLKADYRQTVSELMVEDFMPLWVQWSHDKGCITRNEAHGSPGNLLDLYAAADIPETEFFRFDRNPLVAKFASSAAHVAGRKYTSSETATWLKEHFHVTTGHLKNFIDGLFISGINHMFYHGTCYSPADAPWPGWVFYASTQMNPRNSIWHDADALNAYLARCQAVLQSGRPDNDILLYWPIADLWHQPQGMTEGLTVHHTDWLSKQSIGRVASELWKQGYTFDYISDRQLHQASYDKTIQVAGGAYKTIIIPSCTHMPLETLEKLSELAKAGAVILFEKDMPKDVPGLGDLAKRRAALKSATDALQWKSEETARVSMIGAGAFWSGADVEILLQKADIQRETLVDHTGLEFIRRAETDGNWYFITNQDQQFTENPEIETFQGWLPIARPAESVLIFDPMTSRSGQAAIRKTNIGTTEVYMQMNPGQSLILRTFTKKQSASTQWAYYQKTDAVLDITGNWKVDFIQGGPKLPASFEMSTLKSWTELGDPQNKSFAGTARYSISFDVSDMSADAYQLDLGQVCSSAKVILNGQDLGKIITRPFTVQIPQELLKAKSNLLQVEVTNLSINRIADLDRQGVQWTYFHDINFVNIDYKPFDASDDPLMDSGLLGPVKLYPLGKLNPMSVGKHPTPSTNTKPTLFIVGDSTVKNGTKGLQGWGDPIADFFDRSKINVRNYARGGRSSRTFRTEGLWQNVMDQLKPGDFVLMQFGHNDGGSLNTGRARGTLKGTGPETEEVVMEASGQKEIVHTYGWYMRQYVAEVRQKGATPIVLSPVPRNRWDKQGHVYRASNDYGKWAKQAARSEHGLFIDLNERVAVQYEQAGRQKVDTQYFAEDHTHTTPEGASLNAKVLVEELKTLTDCSLNHYLDS